MSAFPPRRGRAMASPAGLPVLAVLATLASLGAAPSTASAATPLSLDGAVERALGTSPVVARTAAATRGAQARRDAVRSGFYPRLMVDGGVQIWDSAFESPLDFGDALPPQLVDRLGLELEPQTLPVRDQVTYNVNVTVAQPLSQLWQLLESDEALARGVDLAKVQARSEAHALAYGVATAYVQAVQAARAVHIAEASVAQRQAQAGRARALVEGEVLQRDDLLRAELGVASAKQTLLALERQKGLAEALLRSQLGLPATAPLALNVPDADPVALVAGLELGEEPTLTVEARSRRHELEALRVQIAQARIGEDIATTALAPEVSLVGQYQHFGGAELQQEHAFFVGLTLDWTIWDWGQRYAEIDRAEALTEQARHGLLEAERLVALELRQALTSARIARDQVTLAQRSLAQAEENFRLTEARYEAQAATSFDVLDAEALLTRSRAELDTGALSLVVAWLDVQRASGRPWRDAIAPLLARFSAAAAATAPTPEDSTP